MVLMFNFFSSFRRLRSSRISLKFNDRITSSVMPELISCGVLVERQLALLNTGRTRWSPGSGGSGSGVSEKHAVANSREQRTIIRIILQWLFTVSRREFTCLILIYLECNKSGSLYLHFSLSIFKLLKETFELNNLSYQQQSILCQPYLEIYIATLTMTSDLLW